MHDSVESDPLSNQGPSSCSCGQARAPDCASGANSKLKRRRRGEHFSCFPAVLLMILPKCPVCLAGYLGFLGWMGFNQYLDYSWLFALFASMLALVAVRLAADGLRRRNYRLVLLTFLSLALIVFGKLGTEGWWVTGSGIVLMTIAIRISRQFVKSHASGRMMTASMLPTPPSQPMP